MLAPGDAGWDGARQASNLAFDQRPAAVALPAHASDVQEIVSFARQAGLRVASQTTGHGAGPLGSLDQPILLKTSAMNRVEVNPVARRVRVEGGVLWQAVTEAAGVHGLAPLAGSSPDVGVVGYSLGGGIGWLAPPVRHGHQLDPRRGDGHRRWAAGARRRRSRDRPVLGGARRGGNFGLVCALEFALYPLAEVYAGAMIWDWQESERVLRRWSEWALRAPDEVSTFARIMQLPPLPEIPAPIRGRRLVMIDGAYAGDAGAAAEALRPLRELRPELDSFATIPSAGLIRVHGDPEHPVGAVSDHAMLSELPPEAVTRFVETAGPGSGSTLVAAELRQLGGALGRPAPGGGALPMLDADFALYALAMAMDEQMAAAGLDQARRLPAAMAPWSNDRSYLNLTDSPTDTGSAYRADDLRRLQAIRARVDPDGLFQANHPLPAA